MSWFTETAQRYKLHGKPLDELCAYNADVAESLNRKHVNSSVTFMAKSSNFVRHK